MSVALIQMCNFSIQLFGQGFGLLIEMLVFGDLVVVLNEGKLVRMFYLLYVLVHVREVRGHLQEGAFYLCVVGGLLLKLVLLLDYY